MNATQRPRMFFDEGNRPPTVTFDDGESTWQNMPWTHFRCAIWGYADPDTIRVEIGDWQVVISGHNLKALFEAIETARLARVRARPEFADDPAHESDVFATSIRFIYQEDAAQRRGRAAQLRLPI